jgi:hypothetical protein
MDARALAARLDLDLDTIGICLACLSIVSMAIDSRDERQVRRALREMAPDLWKEGLALPVRAVPERAANGGDAEAEAAIPEVARRGGHSPVVQAIVFRLADELNDRMHRDFDRHCPKARVVPLGRR